MHRRSAPRRLGKPEIVTDKNPDLTERRIKDRQVPACLVEELLPVPEVRLAVATEEARPDDGSGIV